MTSDKQTDRQVLSRSPVRDVTRHSAAHRHRWITTLTPGVKVGLEYKVHKPHSSTHLLPVTSRLNSCPTLFFFLLLPLHCLVRARTPCEPKPVHFYRTSIWSFTLRSGRGPSGAYGRCHDDDGVICRNADDSSHYIPFSPAILSIP